MCFKTFTYIIILFATITRTCTGRFCTPADACWPKDADFDALSKNIDGGVVRRGEAAFINATERLYRGWGAAGQALKTPGVVVYVDSTEDVQKTILFARKHGIDLSVVSSGHDYIGRYSKEDSMQINVSKLKLIQVDMNDGASDTGASVKVGVGCQWRDVYGQVDKYNRLVVGANSGTVSMGGFTMGGGHSPLSRSFGLAVNAVLEMTLVLASGEVAHVNETALIIKDAVTNASSSTSDTDLFWALRGGGGSTFGVLTEIKFKIYEPPEEYTVFTCTYPFVKHDYSSVYASQILNFFFKLYSSMSEKWGGSITILSPKQSPILVYKGTQGEVSLNLRYSGTLEDAQVEMQKFVDFHPEWRQQINGSCGFKNYSHFWSAQKLITTPKDLGYSFSFNTLLENTSLSETLTETLVFHMMRLSQEHLQARCIGTLLGGRMKDFSVNSSSVNPALRNADLSVTCTSTWSEENNAMANSIIASVQPFQYDLLDLGKGSYFNEPTILLDDWKEKYWGIHYNRLVTIKQKYDPDNAFNCVQCVGSDLPRIISLSSTSGANMNGSSEKTVVFSLWALFLTVIYCV